MITTRLAAMMSKCPSLILVAMMTLSPVACSTTAQQVCTCNLPLTGITDTDSAIMCGTERDVADFEDTARALCSSANEGDAIACVCSCGPSTQAPCDVFFSPNGTIAFNQ